MDVLGFSIMLVLLAILFVWLGKKVEVKAPAKVEPEDPNHGCREWVKPGGQPMAHWTDDSHRTSEWR